MTVFGKSLDGADVELALLEHLAAWMPTYTAEVRRQKDPDGDRWPVKEQQPHGVAPIRSFTVVHAANEKWPEDQLPMLLAYSPGLVDKPTREGVGIVGAAFGCTVTAIAAGRDMADSKALARLYSTAARMAVLQHESLGGFAAWTEWLDMRHYEVTKGVEAERNLMAVSDVYAIGVEQVLDRDGGVAAPLEDPEIAPDEWPTVKEGGATGEVTFRT